MCSNVYVYIYIHIKYQSSQGWLIWRSKQNIKTALYQSPPSPDQSRAGCLYFVASCTGRCDLTATNWAAPNPTMELLWSLSLRLYCPEARKGLPNMADFYGDLSPKFRRVHRDHWTMRTFTTGSGKPKPCWRLPNFQPRTNQGMFACISTHLSGVCFWFPQTKKIIVDHNLLKPKDIGNHKSLVL